MSPSFISFVSMPADSLRDKKNVFCDLQNDFPLEYTLIGMSSSTPSFQVFFGHWKMEVSSSNLMRGFYFTSF